jgi:tetratricopeptide (TPR) repeat protein
MSDVQAILARSIELGDEGRWEEMARMLADALKDQPDEPYLLCWAAVAERELGNDSAAYDLFRRCIAQEPADAHLLALAGSGLAAFDDADAERVLRAAALTAPDLATARTQYGAYLARSGLFEEALEHLRAGVSLAPDDPVSHGELGVALALKGDMAGAAEAMEAALEIAPTDSWTRLLLGLVRLEEGDTTAGAEALLQAASERAEDGEAQIVAALAAAAAGWADAAEDAIARAEYGVDGSDVELLNEASDAVAAGQAAARAMLIDLLAPSVLHDRLIQPL